MTITLPVTGKDIKPGKILCIGRNYAKHAAELNNPLPEEPMVFLKPSTALLPSGGTIILPQQSEDVHHEVELVAVIGTGGRFISEDDALDHVAGYAVGLDMTARDLQSAAKKKGHPWSVAKGFDTFAPLGNFIAAEQVADPQQLHLTLKVNDAVRQEGNTADMIFSVATLIAHCSRIFTLEPGDLLYTGTPEGVGPVQVGDVLHATIDGFPMLRVDVVRE